MKLAALIKKGGLPAEATATAATHSAVASPLTATVANVAVAVAAPACLMQNEPAAPANDDLGACPATTAVDAELTALPEELPRLTPAEHRQLLGLSDGDIDQLTQYTRLAQRQGYDALMAERVADTLLLRDRQLDDRRMCLECRYLMPGGRCHLARLKRLPGAHVQLEPIKLSLQRCPGFARI